MRLFLSFTASTLLHVIVFLNFNNAAINRGTEQKRANLQVIINNVATLLTEAPSPETVPPEAAEAAPDSPNLPSEAPKKAENDGAESGEDQYFVRSELSAAPYVVTPIDIQAPPTKLATPWKLVIRLYLSETGMVDRLKIEESSAPSYVEEEALIAFRTAQYSPGRINGVAVKSQLLVQVVEQ